MSEDRTEIRKLTGHSMRSSTWERLKVYGADKIFGGEGAPTHGSMVADPRWHAFAEEFKSTRIRCERCSEAKPLQVHHKRYVDGLPLWEYPSSELEVLCDDCHRSQHGLPPNTGVVVRSQAEVDREVQERHEYLLKNDHFGAYAHMCGKKKVEPSEPMPLKRHSSP